jgi:hypothetical protein
MKRIEYKVVVEGGDKYWYLNGELHREDGPAVEWADGSKHWYLNSKRHREDGPAIEYANGDKSWYLNGKWVTEAEVMKTIDIDGKKFTLAQIKAALAKV